MTDVELDKSGKLEQRVRELEAENARLAAESDVTGGGTAAGRARRRGGWWRALLSAVCIVLAGVVLPVAIVAAWSRAQLVDESQFVATLAPLAHDPQVQGLVIDETVAAIDDKVNYDQITGDVIDGIAGLGLPPRAVSALGLLKQPAADGLRNLVHGGVTKFVQSEAFVDVWTGAVRGSHRALTTVATSNGTGVVVLTGDGLGIQLGPIVDQVKQRLTAQGVGAASLIPSVNRTIIIGTGDAATTARVVYRVAVTAGWLLPLITLALFAIGVLLARRRSVAVLGLGVAIALSAVILLALFSAGSIAVSVAADQLKVSPSALDVIYQTLTDQMQHTAVVAAVLGVFIAILGWALGDWSAARRLRTVVGGLNSSARRGLAERGLNTGGFGRWLSRYRVLVRAVVVALAVVWLLLLRPLSFGDIVLVIIVALLVTWMLELLQRRPEETTTAETTEETTAAVDESAPATETTHAPAAALPGRDPASV